MGEVKQRKCGGIGCRGERREKQKNVVCMVVAVVMETKSNSINFWRL